MRRRPPGLPCRLVALLLAAGAGSCTTATVPAGARGVAATAGGGLDELGEGFHLLAPFTRVELYDARGRQHSEVLAGLAADGGELRAGDSLVLYHVAPGELTALARDVGPSYYETLVRPTVQAAVRRVLAGLRSDEVLDPARLRQAQEDITGLAAGRLRPHHIVLEQVLLRNVVSMMPRTQAAMLATGVEAQVVARQPDEIAVAARAAEARRALARGVAQSHQTVAPTLTPGTLADARERAWATLLAAPTTTVATLSSPASDEGETP